MKSVGFHVVVLSLVFVYGAVSAVNTTPAPPKKESSESATEKVGGMDVIDWIRSGALVVGVLACTFAGRQTWLLADLIATAFFGAGMFFFPEPFLSYMTEAKLDVIHIYLTQSIGAFMLSMAVIWYYSRDTRDPAVTVTILVSRVFSIAVIIVASVFDHMKASSDKQKFAPQHLYFGLLGNVLVFLGSLIQLIRSGSFGVGTVNMSDRMSRHLLLDLLFLGPYSFMVFAYPDVILSTVNIKGFIPDGIHAHLIRIIGGAVFGLVIHGFNAFSFSSNADKRAYFFGRLVFYGLIFPTIALYQWKYQFQAPRTAIIGITMGLGLTFNVLAAFFFSGKQKQKKY